MSAVRQNKTDSVRQRLPRALNFLLVDDDPTCLFLHRRILELSGYCASAQSADHGGGALDLLHRAAEGDGPLPDIILLDLHMPVMDGITFLERFRHLEIGKKTDIAIVLLTSSVSMKDRDYALSLGATHFISKPFSPEALHDVVSSIYDCNSPLPAMYPYR